MTALKKDLNRHPSFTKKVLGGCVRATQLAIDNLSKWSQARVHDPVGENKAEVRMSPRGLVLIIGTWNFPCPLVLKPLVSAIAAGNCVVIKLSEISSNTSSLLAKLLGRYLDRDVVRVVQGAIPESTALLRCRFDLIFYTGNTNVVSCFHVFFLSISVSQHTHIHTLGTNRDGSCCTSSYTHCSGTRR